MVISRLLHMAAYQPRFLTHMVKRLPSRSRAADRRYDSVARDLERTDPDAHKAGLRRSTAARAAVLSIVRHKRRRG
jgi:hypothetical protein